MTLPLNRLAILLVFSLSLFAGRAWAQSPTSRRPASDPLPNGTRVELRLGAASGDLDIGGGHTGVYGVLTAIPLRRHGRANRLTLQGAFEYVPLGQSHGVDDTLGAFSRGHHLFLPGVRLGADVLAGARVRADVFAGGLLDVTHTTYLLPTTSSPSGSKNQCGTQAFAAQCETHVTSEASLGAGIRFLRQPGRALYFGLEMGWLQRRGAAFMVTVGGITLH